MDFKNLFSLLCLICAACLTYAFNSSLEIKNGRRKLEERKDRKKVSFMNFGRCYGLLWSGDMPLRGQTRIDVDTGVIANMSVGLVWKNMSGTIGIWGFGYKYILLAYEIPVGSGLQYDMKYNVVGDSLKNSKVFKSNTPHISTELESVKPNETHLFNDHKGSGVFKTHKKPRIETVTLTLERVITNCKARSVWYNGNGTIKIAGGIGNNYINFTFNIPSGVSGWYSYLCTSSKGIEESGKILDPESEDVEFSSQVTVGANRIITEEMYGSLTYSNIPVKLNSSFHVRTPGYKIAEITGGPEWINGTGSVEIHSGGVGEDNTMFVFHVPQYVYGIYYYHFVLK